MKANIPPIKSQGIKTKLVPWIARLVPSNFEGLWIEPFMGTGVVAFNIAPKKALLGDTNPHLINFYSAIASGEITPEIVRQYLTIEGDKLLKKGEAHYYEIRARFNKEHQPLDFLFLNRAGFNGMIRFNKKGDFNIPFCRKPQRFAAAYVTKIVNQVKYTAKLLKIKPFTFKCQPFENTIKTGSRDDIIYCDPPYIDRHVDYYNGWNENNEQTLYEELSATKSQFILSTWHHNDYRENKYIKLIWKRFNILTHEHFYYVGGNEKNRNPMIEAIITNYDISLDELREPKKREQLMLLEAKHNYCA